MPNRTWLAPSGRATNRHVSGGRTFQHAGNRILTALPPADFERLSPHLTEATLAFKMPLHEPDRPITAVCFPDSGVCSVLTVMQNGMSTPPKSQPSATRA